MLDKASLNLFALRINSSFVTKFFSFKNIENILFITMYKEKKKLIRV